MFFMVILGICYLSHHPAAESLGLSNVINTSLCTLTPIIRCGGHLARVTQWRDGRIGPHTPYIGCVTDYYQYMQ